MKGQWIRRTESGDVVVFVHGFFSNGGKAWTHENGTYWPALLSSEPTLESLGIYVFSYQTGIFSGTFSMLDISASLRESLRSDGVIEAKRLTFVCHSMGGIAVRKYLVQNALDLVGAKKEIDLFLVASPSLGSKYGDWFKAVAAFLNHKQALALRFVATNDWLRELDGDFLNLKEGKRLSIGGKELLEDKFIFLSALFKRPIVEEWEGSRYFLHHFKIPGSDHFSIAKPSNLEAPQHRALRDYLQSRYTAGAVPGKGATDTTLPPPPSKSEREPIPALQALVIRARDGVVYFGEEKYNENGRFFVECTFYVFTGIEPVTLLGIDGYYYAKGCPALTLTHSIHLPSEYPAVSLGIGTDVELSPAARLPPNTRVLVRYVRKFQPPRMNQAPADCDNGDIRLKLDWRTDSVMDTNSTEVVFTFSNASIRKMTLADAVREPPFLSDADLRKRVLEGELSEEELKLLLPIHPITRYMEAFNSNSSSSIGYHKCCLLRRLVGNRIEPSLSR